MAIALQRKPVELSGWHLVTQADMVDALTALKSSGWRGGVSYDDSNDAWRLEINTDNPTQHIVAVLGDWLIQDMGVRLLTADQCAANYDEVGS